MTSNSSKIITNDQTGRNSSSEESERKRTKQRQKITLPIFEKKTIPEAKLWWKRFIQYVKMTQDKDLTIMTNDKEILSQYREELELTRRERLKSALYLGLKKAQFFKFVKGGTLSTF